MSLTDAELKIDAGDGLCTNPISIRISGVKPGAEISLRSKLNDLAGVTWTAQGLFVADANGEVDPSTAPSLSGTYTGVDGAGLFWSMQPPTGDDKAFQKTGKTRSHRVGVPELDPYAPYQVEITASRGSKNIARQTIELRKLADGISVEEFDEGRLRGKLLKQTDRASSKGAIVSLTGSGGGVDVTYASALASLGYDVLCLAYFEYADLPSAISQIPLEYFQEASIWLRENLGSEKVAVQGISRGGELTLVILSYLPDHFDGGIALVPMYASGAGWNFETNKIGGPSWTFKGKGIPFADPSGSDTIERMKELSEQSEFGYEAGPYYRRQMDTEETRLNASIPVERASGPMLLISGVEDRMWPCAWGSDMVMSRLASKGFEHKAEHLCLRETGHMIPLPNTVTTFCPAVHHSVLDMFAACGGNPSGSAANSWMTWKVMSEFYEKLF